mmetsp:Transcript_24120/g.60663  ORF Transcript_24120/g.60663 Transcript_24120/m.60663 type:complete len:512 (-) Transcript_24120:208-1743(-)|eukprot:CAMPEP_0173446294 /NCGR_PEP_ID=MMETSP1357-20121228/36291_1 /TAXON_ID=77926 /ORGANISM="Hemiselmis rufescens, Strain PCC563" /LENGTH=511 /DNA_ID=CAMNT_0014412573 /DNA_START=47 /DNA_END=1582 /DNA_ORIENTATION=-
MDGFLKELLGQAGEADWKVLAAGVVATAGLAFLVHYQGSKLWMKFRCRHIPGPPGQVPFLGHALTLLKGNVWRTTADWAKVWGKLYCFTVLGKVYIGICDPELIKHVMQKRIDKYRKAKEHYKVFGCLLGKGIVTSEGERWHTLRKQLAPTFKLDILEGVGSAAVRVTEKLLEALDRACETGEEVDMAEHFRVITLQVISLAVLSIPPEEADASLSALYLPIIDECNERIWYPYRRFLPIPDWWRHRALVASLNAFLEGQVMARWKSKFEGGKVDTQPRDILDRILGNMEGEMTRAKLLELRDGLKTFLFAGHDTTSCTLTWALWELMNSPKDMQECVEEADEVFKNGHQADFNVIKLSLMKVFNVLRETLRIHSPVPVVTRELAEDDEIGGFRIPKGVIVMCNLLGVHHTPDAWPGGDVDKFRPNRFGVAATTSPLTGLGDIDAWAFLPFINGPRNCLGQHFSLLESRVIMGMLIKRYRFTPARGQTGEAHGFKIPITPVNGMRVTLKRR